VLQFADKHPTIPEVTSALNVGTVLEGSVEREGDRLRIQAQLIDAATDAHLWAETYDRSAGDLFAVQSEIAQAVAEQLRIHLTGADTQRLTAQLTSNAQAYEHYVLGRNYVGHLEEDTVDKAISELTIATRLDPKFAAAHAYLSMAYTWQGFLATGKQFDSRKSAQEEARHALELDPTLPEGHLAMAVYLYRGAPDIEQAAKEFKIAIGGLPNDAIAYQNFGLLRRYQGRWEEADELFGRAAALDPQGPSVWIHILALIALGREDEAMKALAAASKANPQEVSYVLGMGEVPRVFSCDLASQERAQRDAASRFPESHDLIEAQAARQTRIV
jgi:tetratricopeptide (TPR) repeat protein